MDSFFESQAKLIHILYQNVENASEVRKLIFAASLPFTLLKPKFIVDEFQLSLAITKAQYNMKEKTMRTKSFQTEIIYCLSPSKNITTSLNTFGTADGDTEMLLIGEESIFHTIKTAVKGDEVPLSQLKTFTDVEAVCEIYQISEEELKTSSLLDSVATKIASKEYI